MKLINGLLSNPTSKDFLEFNEAFNQALKENPNHSLFIEYLRFRYYDSYDMQLFVDKITEEDKNENNYVYLRKEKEHKIQLERLYGPFLSGKDNDDIHTLVNNNSKLQIIKLIITSSNLDNNTFKKYMKNANTDNVYDFYNSYYLQKLENPNLEALEFDIRIEEDKEYRLWNYINLRYEQSNLTKIDLKSIDKSQYENLINKYMFNEIDDPNEPNELIKIIELANFKQKKYEVDDYKQRLEGAIIGRFAGCMLGSPVENWSIDKMEELAKKTNMPFPPTHYWNKVSDGQGLHYKKDKKYYFEKDKMSFVIADDDVTYTVLNALVINKYTKEFTIEDLSEFWYQHIPYACTAEYETMVGLRKHKTIQQIVNTNPYVELIGAAIRADVFGYVCPGDPYKAAKLAYKDAFITHKRNGIYGEMFLAASIAASFSKSPLEAIKIGMNYIPKTSRLYKDLKWALSYKNKLKDYKHAAYLIAKKFKHMNRVHTNNNMCAIVFSIILGHNDFDLTISNCIAMGYDNDCTGASVGSIMGAYLKIENIDKKWYECFNDTIHTYIRGYETIKISDLIDILTQNK